MAEKKPDFVISDRRKFTEEGDLRSHERVESSVKTQEPAPISQSSPGDNDPMPPPPSTAEQEAQHQEYRASGRKLDDLLTEEGHGKVRAPRAAGESKRTSQNTAPGRQGRLPH